MTGNQAMVTFGGGMLERMAEKRADPAALAEMLAGGRVLAMWRGKPLISDTGALVWLTRDSAVLHHAGDAVFLGQAEGHDHFAVDISDWSPEAGAEGVEAGLHGLDRQTHPGLPVTFGFCDLRQVMTGLSPLDAELVATAKALLHWHRSHGYCAACGAKTVMVMGGWQRNCPACAAQHFPRTDPVVIMLITRRDDQGQECCLVGRNAAWANTMYSCLAGFIEPGETIEAAVRREVFEEAGVRVGAVSYVTSQPWPFPASLMLGCIGQAMSEVITIDPQEIESARWVSREDLQAAKAGLHPEISLPRSGSIARYLLEGWIAGNIR